MGKRKKRLTEYTIYTDGGCEKNPGGRGGYGVIVINNSTGNIKQFSQGYKATTNNRMEIMAILAGLNSIPRKSSCTIISDSQLAIKCLSGEWKRNKNLDLWEEMDVLTRCKKIKTHWVKGHDGNPLNELCDKMALMAMKGKNLLEDKGYLMSNRPLKNNNESLLSLTLYTPVGINDDFLYYEPPTDYALCNQAGIENIENFKRKEKKTFNDYASLKTGGMDGWSSMLLDEMKMPGDKAWEVIRFNMHEFSNMVSALRWHKRGLSIEDAILKVLVDKKISERKGKTNGDHR